MHFLSTSSSVAALALFLAATCKANCPAYETVVKNGITSVIDTCKGPIQSSTESIIATTTTPPLRHESGSDAPRQAKCLVTINNIVFNTCDRLKTSEDSSSTTATPPTHPGRVPPPPQDPCLTTRSGTVLNTCNAALVSTTTASPPTTITTAPQSTSIASTVRDQNQCLLTINGMVFNTCNLFVTATGDSSITVAPRHSGFPTFQNRCIVTVSGTAINTCLAEFVDVPDATAAPEPSQVRDEL